MTKRKQMSDSELAKLVDSEIASAKEYDGSDLADDRKNALKYYQGDADIIDFEDNRSSVVSTDLSDHIGWILPQMMRVFASSDRIAEFLATRQEHEQALVGATEYINMKFLRECNGYNILLSSFKEGFMFGNGVIKHWWDNSTEYEIKNYSGLNEMQFVMLAQDDSVSIVEHTENKELAQDELGNPIEVATHDVRLKIKRRTGKLKVKGCPPENFLINKDATSIDEADFLAYRYKATKGELIAQGYPKDKVMDIGQEDDLETSPEYQERHDFSTTGDDSADPTMQRVEVYECYIKTDCDGDDWAEWRRVVMAGGFGSKNNMLYNEPWDGGPCFVDIVPDPEPHSWKGRSLYDELKRIQDIKTVLTRQTLDNLYQVNNPMKIVNEHMVSNADEIQTVELGGMIKTTGPVNEAFADLVTPFVAEQSFNMLEYMDSLAEKRTGVSRQSMALDPEALSNQTATGVQAGQAASFAKTELYARNIAENGLKKLFLALYKLVKANQDNPETFFVNGKWMTVDPSQWPDEVEVEVNVGLGSGSKDRDMQMLTAIKQTQENILMQLGPNNPLVTFKEYVNTLHRMVETAGIKNPEAYFKEVTDEMIAQMSQGGQEKPDPKLIEAQQKLMLERAKAEANMALAEYKAEQELRLKQRTAELDAKLEAERAANDLRLREMELRLEARLTREANMMKAAQNQQPDTNLDRPV